MDANAGPAQSIMNSLQSLLNEFDPSNDSLELTNSNVDSIIQALGDIDASSDNAVQEPCAVKKPKKRRVQPAKPKEDKTLEDEIESYNSVVLAPRVTKKRRVQPVKPKVEDSAQPGWVPKPSDECPVVSWMEGDNIFTVQNPANSGELLLRMQLSAGSDLTYMCGLFLNKDSEEHKITKQLINKLENLWVDKATGIPKIRGLTQTVMPRNNKCASYTVGKPKKSRVTRNKKM